jgi:UDP-N-acetylglucosamine:LPS N-acetylglucosamine transferase
VSLDKRRACSYAFLWRETISPEVRFPRRLRERAWRPAGEAVSDVTVEKRKVLAVASGGGHWVQLQRILQAFEGAEIVLANTAPPPSAPVVPGQAGYYQIRPAGRGTPGSIAAVAQMFSILRIERPDLVVSTGAAPGLVAIALGKVLCRSRTIWIDSIANSERLSLSGRLVRPVADMRLVQWEHLARPGGPEYWGAVL